MSSENTEKKPMLALPSTADETVSVDINDTYKLKEMGPVGNVYLSSCTYVVKILTFFLLRSSY